MILKNYNHVLSLALLVALTVALFSCGGGGSKDESASDEFTEAQQQVAEDIDKVIHDLPSPSEVPFMLQATGSEFNPELISSLDAVESYKTSIDKSSMNLGIYATDVGYLASYEQVQEALLYMEACQSLAETIGIASSFDLELMSRFEENLGNRDSLATLLNDALVLAESRLENDDRLNSAALVLAGAFVEGLYLSTMVVETYPDDLLPEESKNIILEPLIKIVLDQKKPLTDLIELMGDLPEDDMINYMIGELNVLKLIYNDELEEIGNKIKNNTGDYVLTKNELATITYEVKRIRGAITE